MTRMIPIEQLAEERKKILVDVNILYAKTLLEAGVDPETVIAANEKTWAEIGRRMAEALRPMYADKPGLFATDQLGAAIKEIYGMTVQSESVPEGRRFTITHCPWRKRVQELDIENPHRFCRAAHRGFLLALAKNLAPRIVVEMEEEPSGKGEDCCVMVHLFPETKIGKEEAGSPKTEGENQEVGRRKSVVRSQFSEKPTPKAF
jgi:hypothetical protein